MLVNVPTVPRCTRVHPAAQAHAVLQKRCLVKPPGASRSLTRKLRFRPSALHDRSPEAVVQLLDEVGPAKLAQDMGGGWFCLFTAADMCL